MVDKEEIYHGILYNIGTKDYPCYTGVQGLKDFDRVMREEFEKLNIKYKKEQNEKTRRN